jgi:type IV pilus assembly protein PilN
VGYAQSNARVSTLMRNVEASPWLTKPELVEIKLVPVQGSKDPTAKINEFTLSFLIKRALPVETGIGTGGPKPATPAGAAPAPATSSPPGQGSKS